MIAEGWEIFEEVVEAAGTGDLPQLLRSLRVMTMPTPPPPQPAGVVEERAATAVPMEVAGDFRGVTGEERGGVIRASCCYCWGDRKMGLSTVFNCKGVKERL